MTNARIKKADVLEDTAQDAYPWDLILALTPREYTEALLGIKIGKVQRRMLCIHCEAPRRTITTKELARAAGLADHRHVNLNYGPLARSLWKQLGLPSPPKVPKWYGRWIGLLGAGPVRPGVGWKMQMHLNLAKAVRALKQNRWSDNQRGRRAAKSAGADPSRQNRIGCGGGGFGDPEQNLRVMLAAVGAMKRDYRSRGWAVQSMEAEKLGYDLQCSRGSIVHHVEVKGIAGTDCSFVVTANEKGKALTDPAFRLIAVTRALEAKRRELLRFTGSKFLGEFRFAPLSFMATHR